MNEWIEEQTGKVLTRYDAECLGYKTLFFFFCLFSLTETRQNTGLGGALCVSVGKCFCSLKQLYLSGVHYPSKQIAPLRGCPSFV